MQAHALRWRHVIINTKSSWLHGDPRGFRDRQHRIHSSGDYKNPPPQGEHVQLHDYMRARAAERVIIPLDLRVVILRALVERLQKENFQVLTASTGATHAHALVRLPDHLPTIRQIIGRCKRSACESVKKVLPGTIWSEGGEFKPIYQRDHQVRVFNYIYEEQEPDAATWSFRDNLFHPPGKNPGRR